MCKLATSGASPAPDPGWLSGRPESHQRAAKGGGVPIRLPLWNPSPHRPRPGACGPPPWIQPPKAQDGGPVVAPLSHGCAAPAPPAAPGEPRVKCAPGQRQRKEKQGAFWFAPNFCHACHLVQDYLVEARVHLDLHQSLFFSSTPGRSSSSPRRRRGGGRKPDKMASHCLAGEKGKSE